MPKPPRAETTTRKPPDPSTSRDAIDDWMRRVMPDLQPVVQQLDELIRTTLPQPQQYAIKWKKAYYGVPERGWVIELVAYDVSVNVVFLAGAEFDPAPPLGTSGRSRYVKIRSVDEITRPRSRTGSVRPERSRAGSDQNGDGRWLRGDEDTPEHQGGASAPGGCDPAGTPPG